MKAKIHISKWVIDVPARTETIKNEDPLSFISKRVVHYEPVYKLVPDGTGFLHGWGLENCGDGSITRGIVEREDGSMELLPVCLIKIDKS